MSNALRELSDAMAATVEGASSGIVRVEGRRRLPATGIVWSADGVIVTAHHVVEADDAIQIGLPGGESVSAALVGRDPNTDLAVLRVQAELTPPTWAADDQELQVGNLVLALGRPGDSVQATLGVVSAIGESMENGDFDVIMRRVMPHMPPMRPPMPPMPPMPPDAEEFVERATERLRKKARRWQKRRGHAMGRENWWMAVGGQVEGAIQTDVTMYPGFSGGPLVGADGLVYGLNTSALRGISMTIPARVIRRVSETLLTHGRMRRGFLGVGAQPVNLPESQAEELDQETGLLLVSVETGSPADNAGLLLGDIIVALDGQAIESLEELLALLSGDRVGKQVPVQIIRGGQLQEIPVTIGEKV